MVSISLKSVAMKFRFACWTKKFLSIRRVGIIVIGSIAKGKFVSRNSISARIIFR